MKISVVSTVFNEERNISEFLDSVIKQSQKPDEFIIVDGGSKDSTYKILKKYSEKHKWIRAFQKKGANISEGRNLAIEKSKGDIIFTSDSSTRFEKDWIKKISKGFDENTDVVFGKWRIEPHNLVERFLVSRTPNWKNIDPDTFIPSNRQVAFRKKVWKSVGGFPEHIRRADDNWLHLNAHSKGFSYKFVEDAEVVWILERDLKGMVRLAFQDSKTEGFAGIFTERKIYLWEVLLLIVGADLLFLGLAKDLRFFAYPAIIGLIGLFILGGILPLKKAKDWKILIVGPLFFVMLYFSHVLGLIAGLIQRTYKEKE